MFNVKVNVMVPFEVSNVEGESMYDAVENVRKLLQATFPIVVAEKYEQIKDRMIIALDTVTEIKDGKR